MEKRVCRLVFNPEDPRSVSKTQQHFAKDADINNIIRKYHKTGMLGNPLELNKRKPFYGDFSKIKDLQSSLETVRSAREGSDRLSGDLKKKFNQDPQQLLDYVADPVNLEEAVSLGLLPKDRLPKPESKKDPEVKNPAV